MVDEAGNPLPGLGDDQVLVRMRSIVTLDDSTAISFELRSNGTVAIYHQDLLLVNLNTLEAERVNTTIARLVRASKGSDMRALFKAQRDCWRCQADEIHDIHETEAERIERAKTIDGLIRAQRQAKP